MASLIRAIGPATLTQYFEFLDELRDSGVANMVDAAPFLQREYGGMTIIEAREILRAWQDTFSTTLPAADRADDAIDGRTT